MQRWQGVITQVQHSERITMAILWARNLFPLNRSLSGPWRWLKVTDGPVLLLCKFVSTFQIIWFALGTVCGSYIGHSDASCLPFVLMTSIFSFASCCFSHCTWWLWVILFFVLKRNSITDRGRVPLIISGYLTLWRAEVELVAEELIWCQ